MVEKSIKLEDKKYKNYNVYRKKIESNVYNVKIDDFEGPLDLLCFLVKNKKMDIYNINIAELIDEYLNYISTMKKLNLEIASEFIVMTTSLLVIKSKKLLPNNKEEVVEDEEELIDKIIRYKKYKEVSKELGKMYEENSYRMANTNYVLNLPKKEFDATEDEYDYIELAKIYKKMILNYKEKENKKEKDIEKIALRENVSVRSKLKEILIIFKKKATFGFKKVFGKQSKGENVAAFLAVLEMSNKNKVTLKQDGLFEEIEVKKIQNR